MKCEICNGSGMVAVGRWGSRPPRETCSGCGGSGRVAAPTFTFTVSIECETLEQARTVMTERLNCDEDYGFDYTTGWQEHTPTSIEQLVIRDPDAPTDVTTYVNGVSSVGSYAVEEYVDPGAGYTQADWDEYTQGVRENTSYSPAFRDAVVQTRNDYRTNQFISDQEG